MWAWSSCQLILWQRLQNNGIILSMASLIFIKQIYLTCLQHYSRITTWTETSTWVVLWSISSINLNKQDRWFDHLWLTSSYDNVSCNKIYVYNEMDKICCLPFFSCICTRDLKDCWARARVYWFCRNQKSFIKHFSDQCKIMKKKAAPVAQQ